MIGFCGALDFENRSVDFSVLKKMCGLHGGGCAYIKKEFGLLCDEPVADGAELQPLTVSTDNACCTAAVISETEGDGIGTAAEKFIKNYIEYGEDWFSRPYEEYMCALYDSHHGELVLARSGGCGRPLFYGDRDGVLYFAGALRPLIRLHGGLVRIRESVLEEYILRGGEGDAEELFCDISLLPPSAMLVVSPFGRCVIPLEERERGEREAGTESLDLSQMRTELGRLLFRYDYPMLPPRTFDGLKKKQLRAAERQIDKIIEDSREGYLSSLTKLFEVIGKEKSTPLRIRQKGMLAQTFMWLETFDIVLI